MSAPGKFGLAASSCLLTLLLTAPACAWAGKSPPGSPTIADLKSDDFKLQTDQGTTSGTAAAAAAAKAMATYQEFLKVRNADPTLRAEAMRRIADLKLEAGELDRLTKNVTTIDPDSREAIRLYNTLLQAYPDYPRNDQVMLQLARAYESTGQIDLCLATLDKAAVRYPQGRDIADIQFRRGELLFSARRYADAAKAYDAVIAKGAEGSPLYLRSLYKHGWALFKLEDNDGSLKSFGDLLDVELLNDSGGGATRAMRARTKVDREMTEDTLRVMSISFSYLDGPKTITEFLAQRHEPAYGWMLYANLGGFYLDKQRYQDAAVTYHAFVERHAVDANSPALSDLEIEAYRKGGFVDPMLHAKLDYVQRYAFDGAFWNGRQRGQFPKLVANLKVNLKDVAEYFHAQGQRTHKSEDFAAAAHWYRTYMTSFPDDPGLAASNYALADALFEGGQYADAATEYEHTAYNYPANARSAEAGRAALVAYQKEIDGLRPADRAAAQTLATNSALRFAAAFPNHPDSAGVLVRAAQDLYTGGDKTRAAEAANALLTRTSGVDAPKQRIAWAIVAQTSFDGGDFHAAENGYSHALAAAAANDPERPDLTERLAESIYRQAEAKRDAGDNVGAADDFLRAAHVMPPTKVVEAAEYDAAAALIKAEQWPRAIDVLQTYRHDFPKGKFAADVTRKLAVANLSAGRKAAAAAEFETIASAPGTDKAVAREALLQAGDLYLQTGDTVRGAAILERGVHDYPTPVVDAMEMRQKLVDLAVKGGNAERAQYWRHEIIKADASAGAARTDRTRYLAAHASLDLAAPVRDAFAAIKLRSPLKQTLAAKKTSMEAAVQAYKQVANYQVSDTTTAATYETAELYHTLAHDLMTSERPKLSAEELDQYNSLLEEQSFPFEEQSIGIHEINAKRASQGTYDESVQRSFTALAALSPAHYGKTEANSEYAPAGAGAEAPSVEVQEQYRRAILDAGAGDNAQALAVWERFNAAHPDMVAGVIDLGIAQRRSGSLDKSEASLRHATELQSANAVAWNELGVTLRSQGKFADARKAYESAIEADDKLAAAHRNLGVLLDLYLQEPAAALPEFERYKELTHEDKPVDTWIAELRHRTGVKAPPAAAPAEPAAEPTTAPAAPANAVPDANAGAKP